MSSWLAGRTRYKKAGVLLTELVSAPQIQLSLFDTKDREHSARLMTAIDYINTQMGAGTIRYATVGSETDGKCAVLGGHHGIQHAGRSW